MGYKTFKELAESYLKAKSEFEALIEELENTPSPSPWERERLEQLERAHIWWATALDNYGKGKLIEISGFMNLPNKRNKSIISQKSFKYYLVAVSLEDAHQFFENIVKKRYSLVEEKTLSFKEIPTGKLIH